jgi:hypothetical protein
MAAKDVRFSTDARDRILRGVVILNCGENYPRPEGPQRHYRKILWSAARQ